MKTVELKKFIDIQTLPYTFAIGNLGWRASFTDDFDIARDENH